MTDLNFTYLEVGILEEFHRLYGARGFPTPEQVVIVGRQSTPSGRYVSLGSEALLEMADDQLDLAGRYISIPSVPSGVMAVVGVKNHRLTVLELSAYGGDGWTGDEFGWQII